MVFWRRRTSTVLLVASFILAFLYLKASFDHGERFLDESAQAEPHRSVSSTTGEPAVRIVEPGQIEPHHGVSSLPQGPPAEGGEPVPPEHQSEHPSDRQPERQPERQPKQRPIKQEDADLRSSFWRTIPIRHQVLSMAPLPTGTPLKFPKVQHAFGKETKEARTERSERQGAVKSTFLRCWKSYRERAWGHDELMPIAGRGRDPYGGWGATLVDSLDTLWIMGLRDEFEDAVALAMDIYFMPESHDIISVFETNIRYLGGFLAAYDLSGDERLLRKAREVGEMLYVALDTHNRLPIPRLDLILAAQGADQHVDDATALAETGSFSVEFVRLSLLTGDPKWFDAAQRITEAFRQQQDRTFLPGMWPTLVNAHRNMFNRDSTFSLGATADSHYEYLLKTYLLTGGLAPVYREMYTKAADTAYKYTLFQPMVPEHDDDLLLAGIARTRPNNKGTISVELDPESQHLACFAGGMYALGGKILRNRTHVEIGRRLTNGCIWAYDASPSGIMPERFSVVPCPSQSGSDCPWDIGAWAEAVIAKYNSTQGEGKDEEYDAAAAAAAAIAVESDHMPAYNLSAAISRSNDIQLALKLAREQQLRPGFTSIPDRGYYLRPEAIESMFVLYRITGDETLLEIAADMFDAIDERTRTPLANAVLKDVTEPGKMSRLLDSMESFWMGETLKYFFLIFSEPNVVSLDEYVFNTEAHPLKRLLPP